MSRRIALVLIMAAVLTALLAGVVLAQTTDTKQVGLVIAFPDDTRHTEIVTVPADATTFDVLEAAEIELVSELGQFGQAICNINGSGCPADNCFCDAEHYWAYYHLEGGQWVAAPTGTDVFTPTHQAVEGFAWSGFDADFNPNVKPPVLAFEQLGSQTTGPITTPVLIALIVLVVIIAAVVAYMLRMRQAKR